MNSLSMSFRYNGSVILSDREPGLSVVLFNAGGPGTFDIDAFIDSVHVSGPIPVELERMQTKEMSLSLHPHPSWDPKPRDIVVVASKDGKEVSRSKCYCDTVPEGWIDSFDSNFAASFCRIVSGYAERIAGSPDEGDVSELYEELESVSLRTGMTNRYVRVADPSVLMDSGEGTDLDMAAYMLCQLYSRGHCCVFVRMPGALAVGSSDADRRGAEFVKEACTFVEPAKAPAGVPYMVCRDLTTGRVRSFLPIAIKGCDWEELRHE